MEKLNIGVKVTENMLFAGYLTSQKTVTGSRINRKKMKIGRIYPITTPTTEIRMTERPSGII